MSLIYCAIWQEPGLLTESRLFFYQIYRNSTGHSVYVVLWYPCVENGQ